MANELQAFNTSRAIMTVDRVMAVVNMVHDVVQTENDTNRRLDNAWLALQLATANLQELREELERAEIAECDAKEVSDA
jgi:hypothetical protein